MAAPLHLTRTHRILIGVVVAGAVVIAGIGFAGSYAAVRDLAEKKGFGDFALVFPIGIDAGICVLLALDLLLTWIRIPFPLLRQTAWLLTAATIAFNGAAAWPDPLGVGMHSVIPVLFVVCVEAARHAVGRIADITADKHMEGVRFTRWLLSPLPTFLLWRRMKLWELRSYDEVIKLEQDRLVYQARLRSRYGRAWRRKAPVESLMPLRLARFGVPLSESAPAGLAAAGIDPPVLPAAATRPGGPGERGEPAEPVRAAVQPIEQPQHTHPELAPPDDGHTRQHPAPQAAGPQEQHSDQTAPAPAEPQEAPEAQPPNPWFAPPVAPTATQHPEPQPQPPSLPHPQPGYERSYAPEPPYDEWYEQNQHEGDTGGSQTSEFPIPAGPGRTRPLAIPGQRVDAPHQDQHQDPGPHQPEPVEAAEPTASTLPDDVPREEAYFGAFRKYVSEHGDFPNARQFGIYLQDLYGVTGRTGGPLTESSLRGYLRDFRGRYQQELDEQIA
ncbi:DUF2637 domain-containing protein [Streptomyces apocyni]|uniref:DUF2637 domain-containing protein n=1 Tax=Streptomyces apocyni TaxID=2654677 RepID=UPI0012EADEEE|nr:DUF2637 domain-containing protein [Streptomyces apocyni]